MDQEVTGFLAKLLAELDTVPPISNLDEYIHLERQLAEMRTREIRPEHHEGCFAMELAVYFRLCDYDELIGMPHSIMPLGDGTLPKWDYEYPSDP